MNEIKRVLERFLRDQCVRGYIRDWHVERNDLNLSIRVSVRFREGQQLGWTLTDNELLMGGIGAAFYWIERLRCDIRRYSETLNNNFIASEIQLLQMQQMRAQMDTQMFRQMYESHFDTLNPKANKRAAELFTMIVGKDSFDILQASKPLPMKGSQGTDYTLHNRASYCVERVRDQAKLCAVVPGVPLWDHLLGIKLMIEHDEPKFLSIANVSFA